MTNARIRRLPGSRSHQKLYSVYIKKGYSGTTWSWFRLSGMQLELTKIPAQPDIYSKHRVGRTKSFLHILIERKNKYAKMLRKIVID